MRRAYTNQPVGRAYNTAFSDWMATNGFTDIDKGTRSRLADIMAHRPEIETWRQKLPQSERLRKNHPNSIWRGWTLDKRKDGQPVEDAQKTAPKPAPLASATRLRVELEAAKAHIVELEEALRDAKDDYHRLPSESSVDLEWDATDKITSAFATLKPDRWNELTAAINAVGRARNAATDRKNVAVEQPAAEPKPEPKPKRTVVPDDEREARNDAIWEARQRGGKDASFAKLTEQFGLKTARVQQICTFRASQTTA
jgi:hypothetical protein